MIDAAQRGMTAGEGRRGTTVAGIQITDLQTTEGATTAVEMAEVIGGGAQNHHFDVHVAAQGALQRRKRKESEYNSYEMSLCLKKLTYFAGFRLGKAPRQMFLVVIRKRKRGEKRDRKKKQPLRLHHL